MTGEHECNAYDPIATVRRRIEYDRKSWIYRHRIEMIIDAFDVSVMILAIATILYYTIG